MRPGFVYALWSDACPYLKFGRTATSPARRLSEINADPSYRHLGPWHLLACQRVADAFAIESAIHRRFAARRAAIDTPASELFNVSRAEALSVLDRIPVSDLLDPVPLSELEVAPDFMAYLATLFETVGLGAFLDQQEAWVFSLFPATAGGRYFTLSLGRHEVAYSSLRSEPAEDPPLCTFWSPTGWSSEIRRSGLGSARTTAGSSQRPMPPRLPTLRSSGFLRILSTVWDCSRSPPFAAG